MARTLCKCAGQSHVEFEQEQVCPQLLQGVPEEKDAVEARLDVHLWSHGDELYEAWVDVTATHPWKQQSRSAAMATDGAAASGAEQRKRARYGEGRGGVTASPFCSESWGRLGDSAQGVLAQLASQHARAHGAPRSHTLQRWLAQLGIAMYRAMSETVAQARRPCASAEEHVQAEAACLAKPGAADQEDWAE